MNLHRRLLIFCILALAALTIAACGPASAPVSGGDRSPDAWKTAILNTFKAQKENAWRYESDTVTTDGNKGHTTVEYVPPDRYRILSLPNMEMIIIDQQVFALQGKQWVKANIPADSIIDPNSFALLEKSIRNVQCTTPETLDGKPMHLCQYTSATKIGDSEQDIQTKLWIDPATDLPYQMVVDGPVAAMDPQTGKVIPVKATTTIRYTFDPSLKIETPTLSQ